MDLVRKLFVSGLFVYGKCTLSKFRHDITMTFGVITAVKSVPVFQRHLLPPPSG